MASSRKGWVRLWGDHMWLEKVGEIIMKVFMHLRILFLNSELHCPFLHRHVFVINSKCAKLFPPHKNYEKFSFDVWFMRTDEIATVQPERRRAITSINAKPLNFIYDQFTYTFDLCFRCIAPFMFHMIHFAIWRALVLSSPNFNRSWSIAKTMREKLAQFVANALRWNRNRSSW